MSIGVVYKFKPSNKINGSLFYCYEYYRYLKRHQFDVKFYVVGISESDRDTVDDIFNDKYDGWHEDDITVITTTQLYTEGPECAVVLDIDTFYQCKEFFRKEVHCFSNNEHEMFRYKTDRTVTYYGSYPYQPHDVESILRFDFRIHRMGTVQGNGVFVSSLNRQYIRENLVRIRSTYTGKEIFLKTSHSGSGSLFSAIDTVHYVHTERDTNNRIIVEGHLFGCAVVVEDLCPDIYDSIRIRRDDIMNNGLRRYQITMTDPIIQACQRYCNSIRT